MQLPEGSPEPRLGMQPPEGSPEPWLHLKPNPSLDPLLTLQHTAAAHPIFLPGTAALSRAPVGHPETPAPSVGEVSPLTTKLAHVTLCHSYHLHSLLGPPLPPQHRLDAQMLAGLGSPRCGPACQAAHWGVCRGHPALMLQNM